MTEIRRMRERLETALTQATTRHEERSIGNALVELAEATDFREFHELEQLRAAGSAAPLPPPVAVPPASDLPPTLAIHANHHDYRAPARAD